MRGLIYAVLLTLTTLGVVKSDDLDALIEQGWKQRVEPIFAEKYDLIQSACQVKGKQINVTELTSQLKSCAKPLLRTLMEPIRIQGRDVDVVHLGHLMSQAGYAQTAIAPIVNRACVVLPGILNCLEAQYKQVEHCSSDAKITTRAVEFLEQVAKTSCANEGSRIIELAKNDAVCITEYTKRAQSCFTNETRDILSSDESIPKFCSNMNKNMNDCLYDQVDSCQGKQIKVVLRPMLDEIQNWLSTDCLKTEEPEVSAATKYFQNIAVLASSYLVAAFVL